MDKELVKKAYEGAEQDLKDKQVAEVKKVITATLTKMVNLRRDRDIIQKQLRDIDADLKVLKMDINDMKEGRLDRLAERQEADPKAKEASVVIIIKEKVVEREVSPWYWPYHIEWHQPRTTALPWTSGTYVVSDTISTGGGWQTINCSSAKYATQGTYTVGGEVVHVA